MLNFEFFKKGLGIVSPPDFVYDFSIKMFLMLHPLLLAILGNMCITIVSQLVTS